MTPSVPPRDPPQIPCVFGVLGGISSGKSAVARLLAGETGVLVDADRIARAELESAEGVAWLRAEFGPEVLTADGLPDREALAERVFGDAGARRRLEDWTHPRVRATILARLERARAEGARRIVLDVPLLLENDAQHGLARLCGVLVFVDSSASERDRRAVRSRNWKPGEVARREAAQLPLEEKRARADHVLLNEGSVAALEASVSALLAELEG